MLKLQTRVRGGVRGPAHQWALSARRISALLIRARAGYLLLLPTRQLSKKVEFPTSQADVGQGRCALLQSLNQYLLFG